MAEREQRAERERRVASKAEHCRLQVLTSEQIASEMSGEEREKNNNYQIFHKAAAGVGKLGFYSFSIFI